MPRLVLYLVPALLLGYVVVQLAGRELRPDFQFWNGAESVAEAQEAATLVGVYTASCAEAGPAVRGAYAVHPTRKALGPLLWTRTEVSEAVRVVVRLDADTTSVSQLAFDDGAGARIDPDTGAVLSGPFEDGSTSETDLVSGRAATRAVAPERFWLVQDGERVCEFTLQTGA